VRELRNIVIRLTTKYAGQSVTADQLHAELDTQAAEEKASPSTPPTEFSALLDAARRQLQASRSFSLDDTLQQWERGYVEAALLITQGNLSRAAKLLGIHRTTLYSRIQNYSENADKAGLRNS
jgi:DNA-binding NtrC family response regulator